MTTTYLLTYVDFVDDLVVLKFATRRDAETSGFERLAPHRTAKTVSSEADLVDQAQFSTGLLLKLYNVVADQPVKKFETRAVAARRTFAALCARFHQLPVTPVDAPSPAAATPASPGVPVTEAPHPDHGVATPKTPKHQARAPAPRTNKAAAGQPVKSVSEFKPVRTGTDRARLLPLMDGTRTPEEVAAAMNVGRAKPMDAKYVLAHAYCLHRDCGLGYSVADGKLRVLLPAGKTLADAVVEKTEKRAA